MRGRSHWSPVPKVSSAYGDPHLLQRPPDGVGIRTRILYLNTGSLQSGIPLFVSERTCGVGVLGGRGFVGRFTPDPDPVVRDVVCVREGGGTPD